MGVQDKSKYVVLRELLEIPEDEPIFIIRAQDFLAEEVVLNYANRYRALVTKGEPGIHMTPLSRRFLADIHQVADEIWNWQEDNYDKVKVPD